jgi:phage/plasmid-associated DNA primase
MSANKVPRFAEDNESIKRRLVVLPFDHKIENKDPRLEDALIADVPKILSMLIKRVQENVKKNGGKFVVSRNSQTHADAQKHFLLAGNTVAEWAKECLESTVMLPEECYIRVDESYNHYRQWCESSGMKHPMNKINFGKVMTQYILTPSARGSDFAKIKGSDGRVSGVRVYRRTKFKELEAYEG